MNAAVTTHEEPLVSQPMRPVETLEAPKFAMPKGACDAHMHVFGPADKYPCVAHPHYTLPDGKLEHYLRVMPALGIERFIIVQPSFYGTDNSCLLDNLAVAGDSARGVATLDANVSAAELERFHAIGVRAVRLDIFKRASLPLAEIEAYIAQMAAK